MKISDKKLKIILLIIIICMLVFVFGGMRFAEAYNDKILKTCGYDTKQNINVILRREEPIFVEVYKENNGIKLLRVEINEFFNNEYFKVYKSCETRELSNNPKKGDNIILEKFDNSIEGIIIGAVKFKDGINIGSIIVEDKEGNKYTSYGLYDKVELEKKDYIFLEEN